MYILKLNIDGSDQGQQCVFCSFCRASWQLAGWSMSNSIFKVQSLYFSLLVVMQFNYWFQVCNGATYVNVDMLENKKDGSRMLLVEGWSRFSTNSISNALSSFLFTLLACIHRFWKYLQRLKWGNGDMAEWWCLAFLVLGPQAQFDDSFWQEAGLIGTCRGYCMTLQFSSGKFFSSMNPFSLCGSILTMPAKHIML